MASVLQSPEPRLSNLAFDPLHEDELDGVNVLILEHCERTCRDGSCTPRGRTVTHRPLVKHLEGELVDLFVVLIGPQCLACGVLVLLEPVACTELVASVATLVD